MTTSFDIVDLIENNPITKLSITYQNKLLTKIKTKFTENEQQIFVASFYGFLNYDSKMDFVIDLDDVWKWVGFSNKAHSKHLLEKQFIIDKDYKLLLTKPGEQTLQPRGGHNKEIIMLNIATFKKFCLKAGTKKADEIHDYYIKLEETLHEVVHDESTELKLQLEKTNMQLEKTNTELEKSEKTREKIREKTLLEQFGSNVQCVYYGVIDDLSDANEPLIKFGNSNNLKNRVMNHKETYTNFRLLNAFKVENKMQIENAIKEHPMFVERRRTITLKNKKYIELLNANELSFPTLDKTIKDIIMSVECNMENYMKLLEENKRLKKQLETHDGMNNVNELVLLRAENKHLKMDNLKLKKGNKQVLCEPVVTSAIVSETEVENYGIVMQSLKTHNHTKSQDGLYHIDGNTFKILRGTRADVWNGKSYQTTGGVPKSGLIINVTGKIVSKVKSVEGHKNNKFETLQVSCD
jgi:DVNP family/MSV199 domain